MTTNPPLSFPLATGRLIADTSEMDWTQYTYWIESNGPLVVISEQQKLVAYVAQPDVLVDVPEPNYLLLLASVIAAGCAMSHMKPLTILLIFGCFAVSAWQTLSSAFSHDLGGTLFWGVVMSIVSLLGDKILSELR